MVPFTKSRVIRTEALHRDLRVRVGDTMACRCSFFTSWEFSSDTAKTKRKAFYSQTALFVMTELFFLPSCNYIIILQTESSSVCKEHKCQETNLFPYEKDIWQ